MKVLGIDQSFTSTGWCILEDDTVVKHGIITSDKNKTIFERSIDVAEEISSLIKKEEIDYVALEGLPFMSRSNVTRDLAGLQFIIVECLIKLNKSYLIIPPTSLKKFATNSGKASKEDMFEALPKEIKNKFGKTPKTKGRFDITDSYWLAKKGENEWEQTS